MHAPAPVKCTVEPLTLQLPVAAKVTLRPELAVALTVKSGSPYVLFVSGPNEIDCEFSVTVRAVVPLTAPSVAVMVLVPWPTACASPSALIVATAGLAEVQVTEVVRSAVEASA